ncbi:phage baseplate assembly protein V [Niabella aquatica]
MPESSVFSTIEIIIQGYNKNSPVIFSGLSITESLISVNEFSFLMRPSGTEATTLDAIISFKKQVLGKETEINLKDGDTLGHQFKGIIMEVHSSLIDNDFYEFHIEGCGAFRKIDEMPEYRSFYKKKLDAVISDVFRNSGLKNNVKKNPQNTGEHHYIVQYDQTAFAFCASLATRFGEWMFYDGENLQFGKKPEGDPVELLMQREVSNVNIKAQAVRSPKGMVSTDIFKSTVIEATSKEPVPGNDLIKASESSGSGAIEEGLGNIFMSSGFTQDVVKEKFKLEQQAIMASSVYVTGSTRTTKLSVGKIIKIKDTPDDGGKNYILTQVQHTALNSANYMNHFTAVPEEVQVPPYTDPFYICKATAQPAVITDNEDDAGLARVKVKFSWMSDEEKSPWISVLAPHAGKDKGFRFLPEKDDEVMVGFWGGNVETPFVNGALYTEKNTPGITESGNNIKMIGTRSGRRLEIDDDEGLMQIYDNKGTEPPINAVMLKQKDDLLDLVIQSKDSNDKYTSVRLAGKEGFSMFYNDGDKVGRIEFTVSDNKLVVYSKGDISIEAGGSISLDAKQDIHLKAGVNIKCDAGQNLEQKAGVDLSAKAVNVNMKGDATFTAEGMQADLKGMQASVKGDAITMVKGGIVMIN